MPRMVNKGHAIRAPTRRALLRWEVFETGSVYEERLKLFARRIELISVGVNLRNWSITLQFNMV